MTTKLELARKLYDAVKGDQGAFLARVGTEVPLLTKSGAQAYYHNIHREALLKQGWLKNPTVLTLGSSMRTIDIASEPVKRTIVVMLEMELTEEEDTHQTAEIAVDLLNQNLSNDIKLVATTEKN